MIDRDIDVLRSPQRPDAGAFVLRDGVASPRRRKKWYRCKWCDSRATRSEDVGEGDGADVGVVAIEAG